MIKMTGKWLKELRIANNLTQADAAEIFGVKRGTYAAWESKYKSKILPEKVLKSDGLSWLIHFNVRAKKEELRTKETLKRRIIKWIRMLKNLFA